MDAGLLVFGLSFLIGLASVKTVDFINCFYEEHISNYIIDVPIDSSATETRDQKWHLPQAPEWMKRGYMSEYEYLKIDLIYRLDRVPMRGGYG